MEDKGYNEKRSFTCVCCGETTLLTKFASKKTAKCPKCKESGAPIDQEILARILSESPSKSKSKPSGGGETKILPCTKCGKEVEVSKFVSANNVLCDECKGTPSKDQPVQHHLDIDLTRIDHTRMPRMEEYYIMPSIIKNPRLRDVQCPACGTEHMKIIGIVDYSAFGDIIHYQCTNCKDIITVSEQAMRLVSPYKQGTIYDYSGEAIKDLISPLENTRMGTTIQTLIKLLEDNDIKIEGIELPSYRCPAERPVPVGHVLDINDSAIKAIQDSVVFFDSMKTNDKPVDVDKMMIICKQLKEVLKNHKEEENGI